MSFQNLLGFLTYENHTQNIPRSSTFEPDGPRGPMSSQNLPGFLTYENHTQTIPRSCSVGLYAPRGPRPPKLIEFFDLRLGDPRPPQTNFVLDAVAGLSRRGVSPGLLLPETHVGGIFFLITIPPPFITIPPRRRGLKMETRFRDSAIYKFMNI